MIGPSKNTLKGETPNDVCYVVQPPGDGDSVCRVGRRRGEGLIRGFRGKGAQI